MTGQTRKRLIGREISASNGWPDCEIRKTSWLFDTGDSNGVLSFVDATGNTQVWLTQDGNATEQLQPRDNMDLGDGRKVIYGYDGKVVLTGLDHGHGTATVLISADLKQATVTSYDENFNPFIRIAPWVQGVEQTTYDLDTGEVSTPYRASRL